MAQQLRRLAPRPAHDLAELSRHAPMVSGRAPAGVRLARRRELGSPRRWHRRRDAATADPLAFGGRYRDLVAGRPLDLLPLGSHRALGGLEDPGQRRRGRPGDAEWRLPCHGVGGRSVPLLHETLPIGNLACAPLGWGRVGNSQGANELAGMGAYASGALLRGGAVAGAASSTGVHDRVLGLQLSQYDDGLSERRQPRFSSVSDRLARREPFSSVKPRPGSPS